MSDLPHLTVPLDSPDVVKPWPAGFVYGNVLKLLESHMKSMTAKIEELRSWIDCEPLKKVPAERVNDTEPYWNNGYFSRGDARVAYALVRSHRPAAIVEIGGGNSTKFFRKAIAEGYTKTKLVSIDPAPRAEISRIADTVFKQSVLDVDTRLFAAMVANDILFLDGSHLVFNGTDTTHFFLEILPLIKPGVLVHFHNIMLPNEYDEEFTRRGYSEQYLLATLLLYSKEWKPLIPVHYLSQRNILSDGGVSFWIVRT
jgi:predicted O-methyltransferase YrrM